MDEKITQKNMCGLGIFLIQERLCIIDPGILQDQSNYSCGKREGQVKKRHKEITVLYNVLFMQRYGARKCHQ